MTNKIDLNQLDKLRPAVFQTWNNVAADAIGFVESNEEAMEMVLDANRMSMFGYPDADKQISELLKVYDFSEIIKAMCREFKLL